LRFCHEFDRERGATVVVLFNQGVREQSQSGGIGVSEAIHIEAVYAEYMVENVLSVG
jgi:hypothetical protein